MTTTDEQYPTEEEVAEEAAPEVHACETPAKGKTFTCPDCGQKWFVYEHPDSTPDLPLREWTRTD